MDSIYLHGSEDVSRAASTMSRAAEQMQSAAGNISSALEQHQRFMDDWLSRFEALLAEAIAGPRPNDIATVPYRGAHK